MICKQYENTWATGFSNGNLFGSKTKVDFIIRNLKCTKSASHISDCYFEFHDIDEDTENLQNIAGIVCANEGKQREFDLSCVFSIFKSKFQNNYSY